METINQCHLRKQIAMTGIIALSGCLFSSLVSADGGWTIGAGIMVEQSPYRDYDNIILPIPVLHYEGDRFFIKGLDLGAHLVNSKPHQLDINLRYGSMGFDTSDTDDKALKQLDKRRNPLLAGLSYQINTGMGNIRGEIMVDISGHSKAFLGDLKYQYPIKLGRFSITPGFGAQFESKKHNDYYFGVSHTEAYRSGLSQYRAGSGVSPYLSLSANYAFNDHWGAFLFSRYTKLSNAVKDSPMTDRSATFSVGAGLLYKF